MTKPTAASVAHQIRLLGEQHGHSREQVPRAMVRAWASSYHGQAALALCLGAANWGVTGLAAADPAGEFWRGQKPRSGKHWLDGSSRAPWGGLGLPHYDSSSLARIYAHFGVPRGVQGGVWVGSGAPRLYEAVGRDLRWQAWALEVLESSEWGEWMLDDWARRYYQPAYERYVTRGEPPMTAPERHRTTREHTQAIGLAACWSRLANSGLAVARKVLGQGHERMLEAYIAGRPGSEARRRRQYAYARRVGVAVAEVAIPRVDE
jgi:hypothetical protein